MSVLGPGTCFTARALTNSSSKRSSSTTHTALPVDAGRLHRDPLDPQRQKPAPQRQQTMNRRGELLHPLLQLAPPPDANARGHAHPVNIPRARTLNDPLHHQLPSKSRSTTITPRGSFASTKRRCSSCSSQQSRVPAKPPQRQTYARTPSTKQKSASARDPRIAGDHASTRHPRNTDFTHRGSRSPAMTTYVQSRTARRRDGQSDSATRGGRTLEIGRQQQRGVRVGRPVASIRAVEPGAGRCCLRPRARM